MPSVTDLPPLPTDDIPDHVWTDPRPEGENGSKVLGVKFSAPDYKLLQKAARHRGMDLAEYARDVLVRASKFHLARPKA